MNTPYELHEYLIDATWRFHKICDMKMFAYSRKFIIYIGWFFYHLTKMATVMLNLFVFPNLILDPII